MSFLVSFPTSFSVVFLYRFGWFWSNVEFVLAFEIDTQTSFMKLVQMPLGPPSGKFPRQHLVLPDNKRTCWQFPQTTFWYFQTTFWYFQTFSKITIS